jgi:small subunit ribosomal protein S6
MRNYEAMFIFRADLDEETLEKEVGELSTIIKKSGQGTVTLEKIGTKTLAYPISKRNEGFYVCYNFEALPTAILKIKDEIKHRDNILRSLFLSKE